MMETQSLSNKYSLSPELVISAYRQGYFPMAEPNGEIYWHSPNPRSIIPLTKVKMSHSMKQLFRKKTFEYTVNKAFYDVIVECSRRKETWISDEIIKTYSELNKLGFAHSVEAWKDGELAGGLYGVAIGGAFFGESMFTRITNASKACYFFLVERLINKGFILLDSQYINSHTLSLGATLIPRGSYLKILKEAIELPCTFL